METQKIENLVNGSDNENSKFATKNGILTMNQKVVIHTIIQWNFLIINMVKN